MTGPESPDAVPDPWAAPGSVPGRDPSPQTPVPQTPVPQTPVPQPPVPQTPVPQTPGSGAGASGWTDPAAGADSYGRFDTLPATVPEAPRRRRAPVIGIVIGVAALVIVAVALVVGLSGGRQVDAHAVIKTTTEPTAGLGTLVHSHGITVDLPPGWTNLPTTPAELKALARSMSATNPQLAASITQLSTNQLVDHFAIFAVRSRTSVSAPLEDLDVVVGAAGTMTVDDLSLILKTQLAAAGASAVSSSPTTAGTLPAVRVDYTLTLKTATGTQPVPAVAFGVVDGGVAAEIVFNNPGDGADVTSIVDSFAFH